jgi:predicted MFS family arabinose efflux permease
LSEILSQETEAPAAAARGTEFRIVMLGCLLYIAGAAIFYMLPAFLALVGGRLSLDPAKLGAIATVESLGIGIASLTGPFWIGRVDHRLSILIAIAVCAVGNIATGYANSFAMVLACRFVIGLLGEGVFYTIGYLILGAARNVDRAYAIALTAALVYGAAIMAASATLGKILPGVGPLVPLSVAALAVLPCLGWVSLVGRWEQATGGLRAMFQRRSLMPALALAGQATWYAAPGVFWTFAEQVATDKGVPTDTAELALSIGELAGLSGCVLAVWVGDRWGRLKPIAAATAALILPAIFYQVSSEAFALGLFLSIFYSGWQYGTVYEMSFTAALDRSGRAAVLMPAAQVFGMSVSPFLAGRAMVSVGDSAITILTGLFAAGGLALFMVCFAKLGRHAA